MMKNTGKGWEIYFELLSQSVRINSAFYYLVLFRLFGYFW